MLRTHLNLPTIRILKVKFSVLSELNLHTVSCRIQVFNLDAKPCEILSRYNFGFGLAELKPWSYAGRSTIN
jgi:hypothetical protein